ncbi:hypothetical protein B0H16DRAFT_1743848 [Mycena metata]|uniref:Uncharacterized protein n=1 Tax=Mycena metata TaxID=1033252 RepID=A0AAD7H5B8_9AGAR|nr:hypothetical protein B0H16DRAFT_1743848 [Mycena metata]
MITHHTASLPDGAKKRGAPGFHKNVNDWNTELRDFSQDVNNMLKQLAESNPNSGLQDITVHIMFLDPYETVELPIEAPHVTYIPLLVTNPSQFINLYPFPQLSTQEACSRMQGFLIMHPEVVWLGMYWRLTPQAFVERISALIDYHLSVNGGIPTLVGPKLGWTESGLVRLGDQLPPEQFDLARLGTNPNFFLLYFQLRPQLIPHAIYTERDPIQFIYSILCLLRHLPEFSLIFTGYLPPANLLYNVSRAPLLSTAMSNEQGSFAVSPTYSPRFSPPSPGNMAANSDTRPVQAHSELQPYDSEGYICPNHFSIAPVAAVLSQSHQPRDHVVSILNPQSPAPASPVMVPTVPSMAPRYAHAPPRGIYYSCHHPAHTGSEVCPNDQGLPEQHAIPSNPPRRRRPRHAPPRIHRPVTVSPTTIYTGRINPNHP